MEATAVLAAAYTHHMKLLSPKPEAVGSFYRDVMDMKLDRIGEDWICRGPGRRVIFGKGPANTVAFMSFACRDREGFAALRKRAESEGLSVSSGSTPLFTEAFTVIDPCGNSIVFGLAKEDEPMQGLRGPLQHFNIRAQSVEEIEDFYVGKLGFMISDRVRNAEGALTASFMRSSQDHHTMGCFRNVRPSLDHHAYETGEWIGIRDWCDRFAQYGVKTMWGPGRHGPGNNLFVFITDPDGNWIEISAELEVIRDRPFAEWAHEERTLNLWGKAIMRS
jgi:catechol 2,3-dioxygenase-like lactoylglutathione lyase family enzyme